MSKKTSQICEKIMVGGATFVRTQNILRARAFFSRKMNIIHVRANKIVFENGLFFADWRVF